MVLGSALGVVVWESFMGGTKPWVRTTLLPLATLLLVNVLDAWCHNISYYRVSFPLVKSYLEQDFSGILQSEADVLTRYIWGSQVYFKTEKGFNAEL
jgi:hypothetical protein